MRQADTVVVVTDEDGQVIGAMFPGESNTPGVQVFLTSLPGQEVRTVELPPDVAELEPEDQLRAVLRHRLAPDGSRLERPTERPPERRA